MSDDIFLLDTNVISDSSKIAPMPAVSAWLKKQDHLALAFPVILEVETGIANLWASDRLRAAKLREWFDKVLAADYHRPVATPDVARLLSRLYHCRPLERHWQPAKEGRKPGQDLFIAALSMVYEMPIATMNHRDFVQIDRHFPLPGVYNPNLDLWAVPMRRNADPSSATDVVSRDRARRSTRIGWVPAFRSSRREGPAQLIKLWGTAESTGRLDRRETAQNPVFHVVRSR